VGEDGIRGGMKGIIFVGWIGLGLSWISIEGDGRGVSRLGALTSLLSRLACLRNGAISRMPSTDDEMFGVLLES